ncbi:F-box/kelch-repeat protein At3g06240-like [Vicia villosa]|uniref:F-box/kelch-repeat protein At3g06240-like n=1 Tax=Vicia villosa TaxID=3911 RepID=UPI00273C1E77|nr:F-box/kelch-repeat protein At3g06240-like [Vicia villosa]
MAKKSVHLPLELITEILLRLPVKTVLCCKCVCKSWLSLISDPDFGTSHFQLAASQPTHRLVSLKNYCFPLKTLSIDFDASLNDDSSYSSLLSLRFLHLRSFCEIVGSCRGFLLLTCDKDFYIWNPSTGVIKHIPVSVSPITMASNDNLYGFGYDPSIDDYLIVLGSFKHTNDPADSSIDLAIFSLRANQWKQIQSASHFPYWTIANAWLLLNEVIHWFCYNYETSRYAIIAFDFKETRMSEIALPDEFIFSVRNSFSINFDLSELGGLISAYNVENYRIEIWVMQEYKVHSSWTKTLNFSFHPALDFSPLCFTNCGDIVGTVRGGGLVKFNDKGQLLERHSYSNFCFKRSQMVVYRESLLSLPSGTGQALDDS